MSSKKKTKKTPVKSDKNEDMRLERFRSSILRKGWEYERSGLDQSVIFDSISSHLDTLRSTIKWLMVIGLTSCITLLKGDTVKLLSISFEKEYLCIAFSLAHLVFGIVLFIVFQRIGDLVLLLRNENFIDGVSKLSMHPWILNPFSHFGGAGLSRIHERFGYGGLAIFWFLFTAPIIWSDPIGTINVRYVRTLPMVIPFAAAFFARYSIGRVFHIITFRLEELDEKRLKERKRSLKIRNYIYKFCVLLGFVIWGAPIVLMIFE